MRKCKSVLTVATLAVAASQASAIIVVGGDATYGSPPPGLVGYSSVGDTGQGAAVYLGNNWVITPLHVGAQFVTFDNGVVASPVAGTTRTLTVVDEMGVTRTADLILYQINVDPGVPAAVIPASSPAVGTALTMVGYGFSTPTTAVGYDVTMMPDPEDPDEEIWTWTPDNVSPEFTGFALIDAKRKRWANNVTIAIPGDTDSMPNHEVIDLENGTFNQVFVTEFTGAVGNGQGSSQDSGGGVFNSAGELIGIIDAAGFFPDQPGNTVIRGDLTIIVDLSYYRDQISAVIPEPGGVSALLGVGAMMLRRRR